MEGAMYLRVVTLALIIILVVLTMPTETVVASPTLNGSNEWPMEGRATNNVCWTSRQYTDGGGWSVGLNGTVIAKPVAAFNKVFTVTWDGAAMITYALDAASGRVAWARKYVPEYVPQGFPSGYTATPAVSRETGLIYVKTPDGYIVAYDASDGSTPRGWENANAFRNIQSSLIVNGLKVMTGVDTTSPGLRIYDGRDGRALQHFSFTYNVPARGIPVLSDGVAFLRMNDGHLYGVNLYAHGGFYGGADWVINERALTDPILSGMTLYYVREYMGKVELVAARLTPPDSYSLIWTVRLTSRPASSMAMNSTGHIFVTTTRGDLYVIRGGLILRKFKLSYTPIQGSNVALLGEILYYVSGGRLVGVDVESGRVIVTEQLGAAPLGLAVAYGRVYTVAGGKAYSFPVVGRVRVGIKVEPRGYRISVSINSTRISVNGYGEAELWISHTSKLVLSAPTGVVFGNVRLGNLTWIYGDERIGSGKLVVAGVAPWSRRDVQLRYVKYLRSSLVVDVVPSSLENMIKINGEAKNAENFWVEENSSILVRVTASLTSPYNATHYYRFSGWSDCNCSADREVEVNAGDAVHITAYYKLVMGNVLKVMVDQSGVNVSRAVTLLDSDNSSLVTEEVSGNVMYIYSVGAHWVVLNASATVYIDNLTRGVFDHWVVGNKTVAAQTLNVSVSESGVVVASYRVEHLFIVKLTSSPVKVAFKLPDNTTAPENMEIWSSTQPRFTLRVPTLVRISNFSRAVHPRVEATCPVREKVAGGFLLIDFNATAGYTSIRVEYLIQNLTRLYIYSRVNATVAGSPALNMSRSGGTWVYSYYSWSNSTVNINVSVPRYVKINSTSFYRFGGWSDGYRNTTRMFRLRPGEVVRVEVRYDVYRYTTSAENPLPRHFAVLLSLVILGAAATLALSRLR